MDLSKWKRSLQNKKVNVKLTVYYLFNIFGPVLITTSPRRPRRMTPEHAPLEPKFVSVFSNAK